MSIFGIIIGIAVIAVFVVVIAIWIYATITYNRQFREAEPKFTNWTLSCFNIAEPSVTFSYTVDPDTWNNLNNLAVRIKLNDQFVHNSVNYATMDSGLTGGQSVPLSLLFPGGVPNEITATFILVASQAQNQNAYDTQTASVKVEDCTTPSVTPG